MKNESKNVKFLLFSASSAAFPVPKKWESPLDGIWKETSMRHLQFLGQLSLKIKRPLKDSGDTRNVWNPTGLWGQPQTPPRQSQERGWDLQEQQHLREEQTTEIPVPAATFCF